ncbi:hypothetical protein CJ19_040 [Escherichia phage CJ19]|nr:hypothetical protein CJ19_040 [Escherichia phage CJ19]
MFEVKLTILLMGRACAYCKQNFEAKVEASSAEEAVSKVKEMSGVDTTTHKFLVNYVRGISC